MTTCPIGTRYVTELRCTTDPSHRGVLMRYKVIVHETVRCNQEGEYLETISTEEMTCEELDDTYICEVCKSKCKWIEE